ncbi:MAG: AAA family ATPase [Pseudomonadota bacterium]
MTKFLAVTNRRGGVGKTTTTLMLAYGMAVYGQKSVLVVDLDAQASTSSTLMGHEKWDEARQNGRTVGDILIEVYGEGPVNLSPYISSEVGDVHINPGQVAPQIDALPCAFTLDDRELELIYHFASQYSTLEKMYSTVRKRIAEIFRSLNGMYDIIIFDCPPGLSNVAWGALQAVDYAIIPYIPDRTAEDNIGWLASRLLEHNRSLQYRVLANRFQSKSGLMHGVSGSVNHSYASLGLVIPMQMALSKALEYEVNTQTINQKFGVGVGAVRGLYTAAHEWIYHPRMERVA